MKRLIYLFAIFGIASLFNGCTEDMHNPLFGDSEAPGPISNPQVTNLPGAAIITYSLPTDEDLLYVKAEYTITNGVKMESKSSSFTDTIKVEGFGDTNEKTVTLYAVDRSENVSSPVTVKVNPELPDVYAVEQTIEMLGDFGGVQFRWQNENNAPLGFMFMAEDSTGKLSLLDVVYSGVTNGTYTIRGFDPEERRFGVLIRDRWDNYSDTAEITVTPLFEEKLDKSKFNKIVLDNDPPSEWNAWEGKYSYAFDNNIETFNHTYAGSDGWPQYLTVDLGVNARLSRVIVVQRQGFPYAHGNPRLMDIWGIKEEPDQDGSFDKWYPLRVAPVNGCVSIKPSEQGGTADEDQEHLVNGDEYSFTLDDPEVRYIRFVVNETWGLTGFSHFGEITFYGQVVED
ncbi:DUF4959 domain-containing protein [Maribellus sp. YY47]|uniref:DUF4959 domain-containing protein n=1 Tax=Maribellus sp. YY47 TaxID=2929486 RepID=UPI0020006B54|nr:DUF4959 domain-containing protein [Maribellus sp. YY47]MCK3685431.1 DUF4959 domain-containing protein [Maribellus sp. YY47]